MSTVVGHPVPYRIGRKILFVSYVSMAEVLLCGKLEVLDKRRTAWEFIYYALRRGSYNPPRYTRRWVRRLCRWHRRSTIQSLIDFIHEISFPPSLRTVLAAKVPTIDRGTENDMKTTYRQLSLMYGWTPQQISEMSPAQIHIYQTGGPDGTGIVKMSPEEYRSFRAQRGLN